MNRKELIEKNLALLQSSDLEINRLIIGVLFPDYYDLTLSLKFIKSITFNDYTSFSFLDCSLIVIDNLTKLKLLTITYTDNNFLNNLGSMLTTFRSKFNLTMNTQDIIDELLKVENNRKCYNIKCSFEISGYTTTNNFNIKNIKWTNNLI